MPLAKALRNNVRKFDLVHIHTIFYWPTIPASMFCRKYKVPYIISPRGTLHPSCLSKGCFKKKIYSSLIEKKNLKGAALLHFTSEEEKNYPFVFGIRTPSVVAPNGIKRVEFSRLPPKGFFRKKYPELNGKQIVLFMGRIHKVKGLDILIKAFAMARKQNKKMHLVIAGPDDEGYGEKVKKWIETWGIENKVTFTGILLCKEKLAAFSDADVLCLPSYHENFGMVVVEAMAYGLPVVISDQVGIHKDVAHAGAGIVVETDPEQLAGAIVNLLNAPHTCKRMGENGQQLVKEKFALDKVAEQMVDVYQGILSNRLQIENRKMENMMNKVPSQSTTQLMPARRFYEKYWQKTEDAFPTKDPTTPKRLELLFDTLKDIGTVKKILDAGCGGGFFTHAIQKAGYETVGMDISCNAIAQARQMYKDIDFVCNTLDAPWPFENGSFDVIFTTEVIEHVLGLHEMLSEMNRVLKVGGWMILTTPYHGLLKNLAITLFAFDRHFNNIKGGHIHFFTKKSLKKLLNQFGFEIIDTKYIGRVRPIAKSIWLTAKK